MAPNPLEDSLVLAFEAATLQPNHFHHREHLYVAWCYLRALGLGEATARYLLHLRALTLALGVPEKLDVELTRKYLHRLHAAMQSVPPGTAFEALLAAAPELWERPPVSTPEASGGTR